MHIAAAESEWVRREGRAGGRHREEKSIYRAQMENTGKPAHVLDKIIEGKLVSFYSQFVLTRSAVDPRQQRHHRQLITQGDRQDRREHPDQSVRFASARDAE